MKKSIRLVAAALLTAAAGSVFAYSDSFETAAGSTFTSYFSLTPAENDMLTVRIFGSADKFLNFSFQIDGVDGSFVATPSNRSLVAKFSDPKDTSVSLIGGKSYLLTVTGATRSGLAGTLGISGLSGAVVATTAPVPEPGTWAMLLAGLGFVGFVARRRARKV